ncbi:MAG: hypothetical protein LPK45_03285, partial [Bacteroidota bacterium]|nr:hypothetical protein [Bacteroidota bacterium]MDX5430072.1 hypothetical protein [Bacteroidota bacterium]MDX5468836.1 hypothetical protein [Bacteroidota bacterium]
LVWQRQFSEGVRQASWISYLRFEWNNHHSLGLIASHRNGQSATGIIEWCYRVKENHTFTASIQNFSIGALSYGMPYKGVSLQLGLSYHHTRFFATELAFQYDR